MYQYLSLEIPAYQGGMTANTFVRQDAGAKHLGILLPGVAYTTDMPLLYYARTVLLALGADTLSVEANYHRLPGFRAAGPADQYRWVTTDAANACGAALAQRPYERLTLVGKSLGTFAMGYLVAGDQRLARADCIWLTPLLKQEVLRGQIQGARPRSLFVSGGADSLYDAVAQQHLAEALGAQSVVIDGADHSLEILGDPSASLRALEHVVAVIRDFLNEAGA
jgi:pimeloyl-ACP methyl ester carboxylesterase